MNWATLFERAPSDVAVEDVRAALSAHRREAEERRTGNDATDNTPAGGDGADNNATDDNAIDREVESNDAAADRSADEPPESSLARVAADADVLAADLLVAGDARRALEPLWRHSWTTLVASEELLSDAHAVIETLADADLADDWRAQIESWREPTAQPPSDHPALASAYRGGAMHVLSFDEQLTSSQAGAALHDRFPVSVRRPDAFALLFDPAGLYETVEEGQYPGPDRPPRAGNDSAGSDLTDSDSADGNE